MREIDALVAEHVMGQPRECRLVGVGTRADPMRLEPIDGVWRHRTDNEGYWERWSPDGADKVVNELGVLAYSTSISAAWEVVEKMGEQWDVEIFRIHNIPSVEPPTEWICKTGDVIGDGPMFHARDLTASLAICKAALKSVGVEIPSDSTSQE